MLLGIKKELTQDIVIRAILLAYNNGQNFREYITNVDFSNIFELTQRQFNAYQTNKHIKNIFFDKVASTAGAYLSFIEYNKNITEEDEMFWIFLRIAKNHCFVDGNKRTAFITSLLFANSYDLVNLHYKDHIEEALIEIIEKSSNKYIEYGSTEFIDLQEIFFQKFKFSKNTNEEI